MRRRARLSYLMLFIGILGLGLAFVMSMAGEWVVPYARLINVVGDLSLAIVILSVVLMVVGLRPKR